MAQDEALRARVAGREDVAARTVWQLNVHRLRLRCVLVESRYHLQAHDKRWRTIKTGDHAMQLLTGAVSSQAIVDTVARAMGNVEVESALRDAVTESRLVHGDLPRCQHGKPMRDWGGNALKPSCGCREALP